MSKQYGLILPGEEKKPQASSATEIKKPSIFGDSSSSDAEDGPPQARAKKPAFSMGPGAMERRIARQMHEKALEEDPTVFQYDEVYDEMETKKESEKSQVSKDPRKAKYISKLLETAERRKLENELRVERQVQKEREQEGEQFKDKESFVTAAYRKKLEEMRKLQDEDKRDEYLEAIGDVTKQQNIDGFYRHLYEQKMGTSKDVKKPDLQLVTNAGDEEISYKPIKSMKPNKDKQRAYRKRHSSDEDEEESGNLLTSDKEKKKVHLQNNMDADSDFSIDSSSSDEDDDKKDAAKATKNEKSGDQKAGANKTAVDKMDNAKVALNLESLKKGKEDTKPDEVDIKTEKNGNEGIIKKEDEDAAPPKPKKNKEEVWKKRTVGALFDAAVQRYFERKAAKRA